MRTPASLLAVALVAATSCADPPKPAREALPEDPWADMTPTPEWLVATFEVGGGHAGECKRVLGWIEGDENCKGAACERAATLAHDWLKRCPKYMAGSEKRVSAIVEAIEPRASESPSACAADADAMLKGSCGGAVCADMAQRWATRCGKSEGSPLTVRFLERLAERKQDSGEHVELDTRSCDELGAGVTKSVTCHDDFACGDALKAFSFLGTRCTQPEQRPTFAVAAAAMSVAVGAKQKLAPVVVRPDSPLVKAGELPLVLADGSGGIVSVCGERPATLADYRKARAACTGGAIQFARAFKVGNAVEVRLGALAFPDDARFSARFPTLVAMGELEARDGEAFAALRSSIARAVAGSGSASGFAAAMRELRSSFNAGAASLVRPSAAAALADQDEALVSLFTKLGKAKRAAAGGGAPGDGPGILARGQTRPLADVTEAGGIKAGAASRAGRLDLRTALPHATIAYAAALDSGSSRRVDGATQKRAHAAAMGRISACADAEKVVQSAKATLVSCGFGLETCAAGKVEALASDMDAALAEASAAWDAFDTARTGPAGDESSPLAHAAESAGCRAPWW